MSANTQQPAAFNFAKLFSGNTIATATTHGRRGKAPSDAARDMLRSIVCEMTSAARAENNAAADTPVTLSRSTILDRLQERDPKMTDATASGHFRELMTDTAFLSSVCVAIRMDTRRSGPRAETKITIANKVAIAEVLTDMVVRDAVLTMPEVIAECERANIPVSAVRTHAPTVAETLGFKIVEGRRGGKQVDPLKAQLAQALADQLKAANVDPDKIVISQIGGLLSAAYNDAQQATPGAIVGEWKPTAAAQYFKAHHMKDLGDASADGADVDDVDSVDSVDDIPADTVDAVTEENPY